MAFANSLGRASPRIWPMFKWVAGIFWLPLLLCAIVPAVVIEFLDAEITKQMSFLTLAGQVVAVLMFRSRLKYFLGLPSFRFASQTTILFVTSIFGGVLPYTIVVVLNELFNNEFIKCIDMYRLADGNYIFGRHECLNLVLQNDIDIIVRCAVIIGSTVITFWLVLVWILSRAKQRKFVQEYIEGKGTDTSKTDIHAQGQ